MKLQLPKNLLVAVLYCITTTAYGVTFDASSVVTPVEGGKSYLNVGMENTTDAWSGDLVVGDTDTTQGDVDYVGAFTESWGWVTPNGGSSNTTITSGLQVSGSLTVQEGGKIVLGGQYKGGSSYTGLEATKGITVTGGSLTSTKIITTDMTVTGGTVSTKTDNCSSGNDTSWGSNGVKQSYIKNSLTIDGGNVSFGYTTNAQGIGGGKHRMTFFGGDSNFKINQTGGKLTVTGDMDLRSGSTITQSKGTMVFRDTIYMQGAGTTSINQSGDATLILGRLESSGNFLSKPQHDFVINQSGNGLVHLAYGSNLHKAGTVAVNQTGTGTIKIGGGHDTSITGSLPTREDYKNNFLSGGFETNNTKYSIQQSGGGNILVKKGADITASSVSLTNGTLQVEEGARVSASTLNAGTSSVARTATPAISASNVSLTNGALSTDGSTVTNTGTLKAGHIVVNNGVFVNRGVIDALETPQNAASIMLSGSGVVETDALITIGDGGEFVNEGDVKKSILVDGGTLTLNSTSVSGDIVVESGAFDIQSGATVGNLTIADDAVVTFDMSQVQAGDSMAVNLTEGSELSISDKANITVTVSQEMLENLGDTEITLFQGVSNADAVGGATIIFTDGDGDTSNDKVGTITAGSTSGSIKVEIQAVPEPTTATLSLLALAGLAMRRRRK